MYIIYYIYIYIIDTQPPALTCFFNSAALQKLQRDIIAGIILAVHNPVESHQNDWMIGWWLEIPHRKKWMIPQMDPNGCCIVEKPI